MKYEVKGIELNFDEMYGIYEFMKHYFLLEDINQGIDDMIEDNPKFVSLSDGDDGSYNEARQIVIENILKDYNQELEFNGSKDYEFLMNCVDDEVRDAVVGDDND